MKIIAMFVSLSFIFFSLKSDTPIMSNREILDNKNVKEMIKYLNKEFNPNLCKSRHKPKLMILDETVNGNVTELEYMYYFMNGTMKKLIGGNSYKYKVKNDRIMEEQWFGSMVDGKPITKHFYYSNNNYEPDSIILDNAEKIIREQGDRLLMSINTYNKIDKNGFLIQQICTNAKPYVDIYIHNYDLSGRIMEVHYTDCPLTGIIRNKRILDKFYEYEGEIKFQLLFNNNQIVSKYEFRENTNKLKYTYEFKNGEIKSQNGEHDFEYENNVKYDTNKNWISKKIGSDTFIERKISYEL